MTCTLEHVRITLAVSLSKALHHSVDLLSLTRQTKTPQKLPVHDTTIEIKSHVHQVITGLLLFYD